MTGGRPGRSDLSKPKGKRLQPSHGVAVRDWFIPGHGLDRSVITSNTPFYLGREALCKPGTENGVGGYIITAARSFTAAQMDDLYTQSKMAWENPTGWLNYVYQQPTTNEDREALDQGRTELLHQQEDEEAQGNTPQYQDSEPSARPRGTSRKHVDPQHHERRVGSSRTFIQRQDNNLAYPPGFEQGFDQQDTRNYDPGYGTSQKQKQKQKQSNTPRYGSNDDQGFALKTSRENNPDTSQGFDKQDTPNYDPGYDQQDTPKYELGYGTSQKQKQKQKQKQSNTLRYSSNDDQGFALKTGREDNPDTSQGNEPINQRLYSSDYSQSYPQRPTAPGDTRIGDPYGNAGSQATFSSQGYNPPLTSSQDTGFAGTYPSAASPRTYSQQGDTNFGAVSPPRHIKSEYPQQSQEGYGMVPYGNSVASGPMFNTTSQTSHCPNCGKKWDKCLCSQMQM